MVIKITPKQSKRINTLVRKLCCNYVDGNCLLLDDGEEHACVQCISRYGIYCNYFNNAVLPADRELFAEIMQPKAIRARICKIPSSNCWKSGNGRGNETQGRNGKWTIK